MTNPPTSDSSLIPEPIALVPTTPWKYWGIVNRTPSIARIATASRITPQV